MVRDTLLFALDGPADTSPRPHRLAVAEARDWLARVECLLGALQASAAEAAVASEAAELLASFGGGRSGHLPRPSCRLRRDD